jgi:hypothetical protein
MSKNRKPNTNPHTWSEQAAIAWIRTRNLIFARAASIDSDIGLEVRRALWAEKGKLLDTEYNMARARDALYDKVAEGSIRKFGGDKFGGDFSVEDTIKQFPRLKHVPASSAEAHDKHTDTSKVAKVWGPKLGYEDKLTTHDHAVVRVLNERWPDGQLDHKAAARNRFIIEHLLKQGRSKVSERTIERTLNKIRFG